MTNQSTGRLTFRKLPLAMTLTLALPQTLHAAAPDVRIPIAARADNVALVQALIRQKADINAALEDGSSALHWAIANDDLPLVKLLLNAGANPKATTTVGDVEPLAIAAQGGNPEIVASLLRSGADPNAPTGNGTTPLMFAAQSGNVRIVEILLDHGAKIDAKETIYGQNALMFAAAKNRAGVIRVLLKRGADPKAASTVSSLARQRFDDDGNPIGGPAAGGAGGAAATGGVAGIANPGGDPATTGGEAPGGRHGGRRRGGAAQNSDVGTGVSNAQGGVVPTADARPSVLPPAGGDDPDGAPDDPPVAGRGRQGGGGGRSGGGAVAAGAQGGFAGGFGRGPARKFGGNTPLTLAAREGHIDAIRALVEGGADVNEGNANDKTTPIVTAICNGHYDAAKYLLDHGANPNLASTDGLAALYAVIDTQWAPVGWSPNPITDQETNTYLDLMKALLQKGADPNARLLRKLWFRPTHHDESWINAAGASPFWRAAQATDLAAMRLLIAHDADPKSATNDGVNALMAAAGLGWNGNYSTQGPDTPIACVQYCLDLGLDPTPANAQGYTALGGAAYRGDNDLIKLLLAHGAKLDTRTARGWSITDMANGPALRSSVPVPHPQTVALLLSLGAPPLTSTADEEILGIIRKRRPAAADESAAPTAGPNGDK